MHGSVKDNLDIVFYHHKFNFVNLFNHWEAKLHSTSSSLLVYVNQHIATDYANIQIFKNF